MSHILADATAICRFLQEVISRDKRYGQSECKSGFTAVWSRDGATIGVLDLWTKTSEGEEAMSHRTKVTQVRKRAVRHKKIARNRNPPIL